MRGVAIRYINHNTWKAAREKSEKQFSHKEHEIKNDLPVGRVRVCVFLCGASFVFYYLFAFCCVALLLLYPAQIIY